jgi:hypothetical protein
MVTKTRPNQDPQVSPLGTNGAGELKTVTDICTKLEARNTKHEIRNKHKLPKSQFSKQEQAPPERRQFMLFYFAVVVGDGDGYGLLGGIAGGIGCLIDKGINPG